MPDPFRDPSEVLDSIGEKARLVKEAAVALTQNIEVVQSYLATVRGRTEAGCFGPHPDDSEDQNSLYLKFQKDGNTWVISWARWVDPEQEIALKPLLEAPLRVKISAAKMLPDLLESIESEQVKLIDELTKSAAEVLGFFNSLPNKGGKQ